MKTIIGVNGRLMLLLMIKFVTLREPGVALLEIRAFCEPSIAKTIVGVNGRLMLRPMIKFMTLREPGVALLEIRLMIRFLERIWQSIWQTSSRTW